MQQELTPAHTTAQYILRNTQTHIHMLLIQILYRIKWQHPDQIIQISLFFKLLLACASTSLLPCFHSFAAVSPLSQQSSILTANFNALHDSVHICCCRIVLLLVPNCFHLFHLLLTLLSSCFLHSLFRSSVLYFPRPTHLTQPPRAQINMQLISVNYTNAFFNFLAYHIACHCIHGWTWSR